MPAQIAWTSAPRSRNPNPAAGPAFVVTFDVNGSFVRALSPISAMPDIPFPIPLLIPGNPDVPGTRWASDGFHNGRRGCLGDDNLSRHGPGFLHDYRTTFRTSGCGQCA